MRGRGVRLSKEDRERNRRQAAEAKKRREKELDEMGFTGKCSACGSRTLPHIARSWPNSLCPDCRQERGQ
jgi:uncharacterized OB-fold protein